MVLPRAEKACEGFEELDPAPAVRVPILEVGEILLAEGHPRRVVADRGEGHRDERERVAGSRGGGAVAPTGS